MHNLTPENKLMNSSINFNFKKDLFKLDKEKNKTPIKKQQKSLKFPLMGKEDSNESKTPIKHKTEINPNFTNFGNLASKNKTKGSFIEKSKNTKTLIPGERKSSVINPTLNNFNMNEKKFKGTKSPLK